MIIDKVYEHVLREKKRVECPENAKVDDTGYGKLWILLKVLSRLNWGRFGKTEKEIKQELKNIKQIVDNTPASEDFKKGAYFMLGKISGYFAFALQ